METAAKALVYSVPVTGLTVWIYKGSRRAETYLYVPEENNFERVPGELLDAMGTLTFVMELEIDEQRRLARVDAKKVLESVSQTGYFLQLPPIEPEGDRRLQ
jgi:uncharacterized protein YcgL (UPF0745 family)